MENQLMEAKLYLLSFTPLVISVLFVTSLFLERTSGYIALGITILLMLTHVWMVLILLGEKKEKSYYIERRK